jgi:hypothetical protein
MGIESIHLSPGNKPENFSKRREHCGAIGQNRRFEPGSRRGTARTPGSIKLTKTEKLRRMAPLALPSLEASLRLVDDVDAALAAYEAIIAVSAAQRFQ